LAGAEERLKVNPKSTPPIPEAIVQAQRQLDQFRSAQPRRTKLPESVWQAAVELAPALSDLAVVRGILQADPIWSVYALGDLAPDFSGKCSWYWTPGEEPALVLIYRGFSPPIFFATGKPDALEPLLNEIAAEPVLSLHVRPEVLRMVAAHYRIREEKSVWRMAIRAENFRPTAVENCIRLGPADLSSIQSLYADGRVAGEAPEYFSASSLEDGVFFGIRERQELVAVAGTHLVSQREGVAAAGNVYTRRDLRGNGLAAQTASAVVKELLQRGIGTIALNVLQRNLSAIHVYEKLGFEKYCEFCEGFAYR
jgi:GNAT superfamily N-acetyltransferase